MHYITTQKKGVGKLKFRIMSDALSFNAKEASDISH